MLNKFVFKYKHNNHIDLVKIKKTQDNLFRLSWAFLGYMNSQAEDRTQVTD